MCAASRINAMCIRFPNCPGVSFFTNTGAFPHAFNKSRTPSASASEVRAPITTSTNGIKCGGFQKCVVITRSGRAHRSAIAVMLNPDVFDVNTASVNPSIRPNNSCLNARFSGPDSTTNSAAATSSSNAEEARKCASENATCSAVAKPFAANKANCRRAAASPACALASVLPKITALTPPSVKVIAIPGPIIPVPITAAFIYFNSIVSVR